MNPFPALLETPRLTFIHKFDGRAPGNKSFHEHEEPEVIFIADGKGDIVVAGRTLSVATGELILLNPNVTHETPFSIGPSLKGFSLNMGNLAVTNLPPGYLISEDDYPVWSVKDHHLTITRYLEELAQEFEESKPGSGEIASSLLTALLLKMFRTKYAAKPDQSASISEKTKKYIEQNYHLELTLNDLANHVFVSPYHLSHTFKNEVGVSPIQYLIQYRMEVAKNLLRTTNLSISEIAYSVGYPNANYFNLIFKKLAGVSPGKYRKH